MLVLQASQYYLSIFYRQSHGTNTFDSYFLFDKQTEHLILAVYTKLQNKNAMVSKKTALKNLKYPHLRQSNNSII